MNQTKKLPFGRKTIVGLSILLQILIITTIFFVLNLYFIIFRYISAAVFAAAVVTVFLRDMPYESKVSWLVLLIFVPFLGLVVYILLSHNRLTKREAYLLSSAREQQKALTPHNANLDRSLTPDQVLQADYIESASGDGVYFNTDVKYYPYGETFFADYLNDLESAKEFIFLEYFLVAKGEMLNRVLAVLERKAAQGVDVRIIYDDFATANRLESNFAEILNSKGIKAYRFNKMIPVVSPFHNNRDHRKITVVDGKVAYTGGINIADEYLNLENPFGVWKDTAIRLYGPAVDKLTLIFLTGFCMCADKTEMFDRYVGRTQDVECHGVIIPFGDGPKPIYDRYVTENVYINFINSARRYVWISSPYLICDGKLKKSLENAAARGVDVRIVLPHNPDKKTIFELGRSNYKRLQKNGVKIFEYEPGFVHAKQLVSDGVAAIVGTANLDYRSLLYNFENGVLMFNTDCIADIEADFKSVFMRSTSMDGFNQNGVVKFFCKIAGLFQPLL